MARATPVEAPQDARPRVPLLHNAGNSILVSTTQKGNPASQAPAFLLVATTADAPQILTHVRNVAWEYGDILPDYQVGATTGVLFLSIRYHRLHPEYIHGRIAKLGQTYHLRILLVMCDVEDHQDVIKELTKIALVNHMTMMVAWSNQEAGRYLEVYKSFERKGPDLIRERVEKDYMSQITAALTGIRGVNKTDVLTLTSNFGSLSRIVEAGPDELAMCPGLGEKKVRRLRDCFAGGFSMRTTRSAAETNAAHGPALN